MKKFEVTVYVTGSQTFLVDAENAEAAEEAIHNCEGMLLNDDIEFADVPFIVAESTQVMTQTYDAFVARLRDIFKCHTIERDNNGQIIVYTALTTDAEGNIVDF